MLAAVFFWNRSDGLSKLRPYIGIGKSRPAAGPNLTLAGRHGSRPKGKMLNFRQDNPGRAAGRAAPRAAFTILELLIVICLIAILVGFALPSYLAVKEKALRRKAVITAKHLEVAFNEYYNLNQGWPSKGSGPYAVKGDVLGALATGCNGIVYFEIGTNTVETFKDPWCENYYQVAFDENFDNQVTPAEGAPGLTLRKSVIVWSVHTNRNVTPPEVVTNKSWE